MIRKHPRDMHTSRLEQFDASWRREVLPSGLTLFSIPRPHDDHFFLGVTLKVGTRLERGKHKPGVSHFLEHMMFRGSKRYPDYAQLAEAFEWLGGDWNAATGQEHTEYWYSGIKHTAAEVIDLFADFIATPQFTDIEVERSIITRELDGETNDHGHCTDLDYHIATLLWPGTTLAQPILGTRESIASMTVDDLRRYRDAFYVPQNMAISVVGGDDHLLDLLRSAFGNLRADFRDVNKVAFPPLANYKGPTVKWVEHSDNEYEIKLSFVCGSEWSSEAQTVELVSRILADGFCSRLGRRLREQLGLVYDIHAHPSLGLDVGTLDIGASCAQDQLDEFMTELLRELARLATDGPTSDELERARVRSIVDLELAPTVPEVIGTRLPWAYLAGRNLSLVEERERLKAVTTEAAAEWCKRTLTASNAALAVLGPAAKDIEKRLKKALVAGLTTAG